MLSVVRVGSAHLIPMCLWGIRLTAVLVTASVNGRLGTSKRLCLAQSGRKVLHKTHRVIGSSPLVYLFSHVQFNAILWISPRLLAIPFFS